MTTQPKPTEAGEDQDKHSIDNTTIEYELNTAQCVKVAKFIYKEWEKAMTPPLLVWKSFPDWLELVITNENK